MNARDELARFMFERNLKAEDVAAATITFMRYPAQKPRPKTFVLGTTHTAEQAGWFWAFLHRDYHAGYGPQQMFGTIWFKNGAWAERTAKDSAEWWEYRVRPPAPEEGTSDPSTLPHKPPRQDPLTTVLGIVCAKHLDTDTNP